MRYVFAAVIALHGAIHLLGAFGNAPTIPTQSGPRRLLWCAGAILFFASSILLSRSQRSWVFVAVPAVVLSQLAITTVWSEARFGTLMNLAIAVPLTIAIADRRPSSLTSIFAREAATALATVPSAPPELITEADLDQHPEIIQRFLRRAGAVGHQRVHNFRLTLAAQMRGGPRKGWMRATAEQYEFFHPPTRLFFMRASRAGLPIHVLHRYQGDSATMEVRVAGLFTAQRLDGPEMTRSETVTLLNDICLLAPAALLEVPVRWEPLSDSTVRATYSNAGHTVSAILTIDPQGDLVNFTSEDRSMAQGDTMVPLPFSTPVTHTAEFDGLRVVADAEARYQQDGVEWAYGKFRMTTMQFNVR